MTWSNGRCFSIPSLLPTIQERLLESISAVLSRSHHAQARPSVPVNRGNLTSATQQVPELSGSALVQLALQTLAQFNFKVFLLELTFIFTSFTRHYTSNLLVVLGSRSS